MCIATLVLCATRKVRPVESSTEKGDTTERAGSRRSAGPLNFVVDLKSLISSTTPGQREELQEQFWELGAFDLNAALGWLSFCVYAEGNITTCLDRTSDERAEHLEYHLFLDGREVPLRLTNGGVSIHSFRSCPRQE